MLSTIAICLAAVIMLVLLLRIRTRWMIPVRELAATARRMASGDWAARAAVSGAEDARALAAQLNQLAEAAQRQLAELDLQRSDLQQLVDSLPDPVLLSDSLQRLILVNSAASRMLEVPVEQALGKKFFNVVNDAQILDLFESLQLNAASRPPGAIQRDIRIARGTVRNFYQAVGTRTKAGGNLIVLRNVTTMASAIQMKTDFVANASHELRTPLSAIKAAFETLREVREEDPQQAARCIEIIDGHIFRLEEMLRDLLDLSRVETPDLQPQVTGLSAGALFAELRQGLGAMAEQKGVSLTFSGEQLSFGSDKRLLGLVLKNLVENSIKFTPAGGTVAVSAVASSGDSRQVVLRVKDTGIGIPPEHLERVFERFYQVDASRTGGASRGTGLGLAIVKHAIHALGGSVHLDSVVGQGTTAICVIPDVPLRSSPAAVAAHA